MDAMSNHDIGKALCKYSSFLGVFSSDINPLSILKSYPCCFVMNTKPRSNRNGGHWVAFYLTSPNFIEYFDSLGLSIHSYSSLYHYFSHIPNLKTINIPLQNASTSLCGDYAIAFLTIRSSSLSYDSTINIIKSHSKGIDRDSFVRRIRLLNVTK